MNTLEFKDGVLKLIDQTKLPSELIYAECFTYKDVADAIARMVVRGAPAIGVTAAYGVAMGAAAIQASGHEDFFKELESICNTIQNARPTAVNLFWAVERMRRKAEALKQRPLDEIKKALFEEADFMANEDIAVNKAIGAYGASLIRGGATVLTHCNAGALATCGYGTALGVIRAAHEAGRRVSVYSDETRPWLQGARLTAWELAKDGIPVTLICDNMAGHFMKAGRIDLVVVGADRIAKNGDTANKIGTYSLAVLAKENQIPFYVAAPTSTIDFSIDSGDEIPIEERNPEEVTHIRGIRIAPEGVRAANPAFDVTPGKYITGIITEKGIVYPPYHKTIPKLSKLCR
jgi:methylthioribose-1-phosphate isomerase